MIVVLGFLILQAGLAGTPSSVHYSALAVQTTVDSESECSAVALSLSVTVTH